MNLDRLVIKVFKINEVVFSDKTQISNDVLSIDKGIVDSLQQEEKYSGVIKQIEIKILAPGETNVKLNSTMDVIPISTKVLGKIGYGITHTLLGVNVLLTGIDESGQQIGEFGDSAGILSEKIKFSKAGTPKETDFNIIFNITVYKNQHLHRETINLCHEACDIFMQSIREKLKKIQGHFCNEKHEFYNRKTIHPNSKKIVILKQVTGQGAMYDTRFFAQEPSGYIGGRSIIDCMNMPVFISANEYRDGAVRAMN